MKVLNKIESFVQSLTTKLDTFKTAEAEALKAEARDILNEIKSAKATLSPMVEAAKGLSDKVNA